jgi:hypothetical protein
MAFDMDVVRFNAHGPESKSSFYFASGQLFCSQKEVLALERLHDSYKGGGVAAGAWALAATASGCSPPGHEWLGVGPGP